MGPLLADPALAKCGQNLKYDTQTLRGAGLELAGVVFDTMVASYLLEAERRSHGLDALALDMLNHACIPFTEIIGSGAAQIPITEADPVRLATYGAEDANVTFRLWQAMAPRIEAEGLGSLFRDVEMPLVRVLADMEWEGVKVDTQLLATISGELGVGLESLRGKITAAAGVEFNVDSPKQLGEVLFDRLGLPVVRRTKSSRSTDAEVLATLAPSHPLPKLVLDYRELAKLKNTYVDVLPGLVSPVSGRVHPSYHQAVAATGRLSSSDPNIQNIPIRTKEGKRIRGAFVAERPGDVLISADYSQIELRVLAHFSGDPVMRAAFEAGEDIHRWVASEIWGLPRDEIPAELRTRAKAVNFGIIYGQTAFGLARTLGIPRPEAAAFIGAYKEKFKGIAGFVERALEEARAHGEVRTILGRRRKLADIDSRNRMTREQAERLAVNTIIQGSAADLIKVAMLRLHRRIRDERLPARLLIQVHDELVFEASGDDAKDLSALIAAEMTSAIPLTVPLKVDIGSGTSWLACKP
jgi:DNA polymerase-1